MDDAGRHSAFDLTILEDVVAELYKGLSSNKLVATVLLMNLCTIHGMTNKFCDEFFHITTSSFLLVDNCLPINYHFAKSLTRKLGLDCVNIHACLVGCVFFKKELANELHALNVEVLDTKMRRITHTL